MGTRGRYNVERLRGNNALWLRNRLLTGPDWKAAVATISGATVLVILVFAIAVPFLLTDLSPYGFILLGAMVTLILISAFSFFLTATSDPGIIPRANEHAAEIADNPGYPRERKLVVNGVALRNRYCETCRLWRPPRASHCAVCNNCVERFDHHCPYVGNCIGRRNYKTFFLFVSSTATLCFLALVSIVLVLWKKTQNFEAQAEETDEWAFILTLQDGGTAVLLPLFLFILLAFAFTFGLTSFHIYLMSTNSTTAEKVKKTWKDTDNPFVERGCRAMQTLICTTKTHSKMKQGYSGPATDFDMVEVVVEPPAVPAAHTDHDPVRSALPN